MTASRSSNEAKYESGNVVVRTLLSRFQARAVTMLRPFSFRTVLDVGCGEAYFARVLLDAFPGVTLDGVDSSASAIAKARLRCPEASFEARAFEGSSDRATPHDLVVCSEVLEHLHDPDAMLEKLGAASGSLLFLSVPWEPWFRLANFARGRHLTRWGNHPEHVRHWGARAFVTFVERRFDVLVHATSFPWTLVVARKR